MTSTSPNELNSAASTLVVRSRILFFGAAVVIVSSVILQVFFAGAAILVHPEYWGYHGIFGYVVGLLILGLLIAGYIARLPQTLLRLVWLMVALYLCQFIFLYVFPLLGMSLLRAFHAANALAIFWVAMRVAEQLHRLRCSPTLAPKLHERS